MNSNSSPHSRPARRPQRRPRSTANASGAGSSRNSPGDITRGAVRVQRAHKSAEGAKAAPAAAHLSIGQRIRRVGLKLAIPHAVIIMSIIVIAVAALLIASESIAVLPSIIATAWLIMQAAPVAGDDAVIAAVPLLPVVLTIALSARQVRASVRKRFSIIDLLMVFAWSLVIPVVLSVIALLMLADAQTVYPVAVPPISSVMLSVVVVHLLAFVCGLGPKAWRALARRYRVPESIVDGVVIGVKSLGWLCLAAAAVGVALFVLGWEKQEQIMAAYPQAETGGRFALFLSSVLYIPNAVIGVAGVLLGSEYQFGAASVSLFETHLVPLPPLPLMGLVPASSASWAWIGLFVPIAVLVAVMLRLRPSPIMTLSAGLTAWLLTSAAAYLSGGVVGAYENTGVPVLWTASLALIWIGGIALAVTLMLFVVQRRQQPALLVDEAVAEPAEEETAGGRADEHPEADHFVAGELDDDYRDDAYGDDEYGDAEDRDDDATVAEESSADDSADEETVAGQEAAEDTGETDASVSDEDTDAHVNEEDADVGAGEEGEAGASEEGEDSDESDDGKRTE